MTDAPIDSEFDSPNPAGDDAGADQPMMGQGPGDASGMGGAIDAGIPGGPMPGGPMPGGSMPGGQDVNDPRFDDPAAAAPAPARTASSPRLDLLDVPLAVTVELGRTKMPISDVLNLASGAVIELEKMAGEPLDLLLNGRLVARGEAVVVGERFGIRITTIVSPRERLARLN